MPSISPDIEIINSSVSRGRFRFVLFDFDGTLSLIREGWPKVMIPMMVRELAATPSEESEAELSEKVEEFIMRLNGRQTIYQMIQLADEVKKRGGTPAEPLEYKHRYHDLLMDRIQSRIAALESGQATAEEWTLPESHQLLGDLKQRGMELYLASGTDLKYVRMEAELLGLAPYFGEHIYAALDEFKSFSKKMIIERIIAENKLQGPELLGFGDGFVEIEEIKRVGGVAIGVASEEEKRKGVDEWKRQRLIQAGADVIIPEYRCRESLLGWLFDSQ